MSGVPLLYVLGLLIRIKPGLSAGHSALSYVQAWADGGGQEAQFKLVIAIQSNLTEAREFVENSDLLDQTKDSLYITIDALINVFSLGNIQNGINSVISDSSLNQSITIFSFATRDINLDIPEEFAKQRDDLVQYLKTFLGELERFDIDERLKDVSKRQILLLIALLNNAEAVGVEAAISAYMELFIKLKNRFNAKDEKQQAENSKLWDVVKSWSEKFDALSKLYDFGNKLLPHFDKLPQIPGFL